MTSKKKEKQNTKIKEKKVAPDELYLPPTRPPLDESTDHQRHEIRMDRLERNTTRDGKKTKIHSKKDRKERNKKEREREAY
jgi:hypothetical protein